MKHKAKDHHVKRTRTIGRQVQLGEPWAENKYLAKIGARRLSLKDCSYDLHIRKSHLPEYDFREARLKEGRLSAGKSGNHEVEKNRYGLNKKIASKHPQQRDIAVGRILIFIKFHSRTNNLMGCYLFQK